MSKKLSKLIFQQFGSKMSVIQQLERNGICHSHFCSSDLQVTRLFQSLLSKSEIALLQNNSGYPLLFWDLFIYFFLENYNIHKKFVWPFLGTPDPLIETMIHSSRNYQLEGLESKNKGHINFYERCNLT